MPNELSNPSLSNAKLRRKVLTPDPQNYAEFLDLLYDDIDLGIKELAKYRDVFHKGLKNNSEEAEDLINVIICMFLQGRGWQASHDTSINGHADIVVTLPYEDYHWLGEGKIYGGSSYSTKGFKQLAHRYATGLDGQNAGGLLIYVNSTKYPQLKILNNWKNTLLTMPQIETLDDNTLPLSTASSTSPCIKNSLAFYSHHKHALSGLDYDIRHMTIDFRHDTKD